jgi:hypothetical protein
MDRTLMIAAVAAVTLLSACGKTPKHAAGGPAVNYTVKGADGATTHITAGGPAAAAAMPAYAPLYPGAVIESSMTGAGTGGAGGMVIFRTRARPMQVIGFYKGKAAAAGFGNVFSSENGEGLMFTADKESGQDSFNVTATPDNQATIVVLTWTDPKKG